MTDATRPGRGRLGRAETFRRRHQVGDIVPGALLEWVGDGLGWFEVNGHRLLARTELATEPGDAVAFMIVALQPDITLRPVKPKRGHGLNLRV